MRYLDITPSDLSAAQDRLAVPRTYLGALLATSVAGNGITGSIFYTFPLVAAAAGESCPFVSVSNR